MTRTSLDPELAELAAAVAASRQPPITALTPAQARARVLAGNALCSGGPNVAVRDLEVPADGGPVVVREYLPRNTRDERVLVYLHGGGWVTGDLDYSDQACRHLAAACYATVVSVDYRLAPEHHFPAAVEDAWAVLRWAARSYPSAGGLVVAGDSAGGSLAAACAVRSRDAGAPSLHGQLLVYPVLDHDLSRASYDENRDGFPMGSAAMRWFWDHYVPDESLRADPLASPLRVTSVERLPPAVIVVAGHDPLRDEAEAYAGRLVEAGVPVTVLRHPSLGHGFLRLTGRCAAARDALAEIVRATGALFETPASRDPRSSS